MAAHDLLSPEQEVSLAQEIEKRETAAWVELFRFRPALEQVLGLLETNLEDAVNGLDPLKERLTGQPDAPDLDDLARALAAELALLDRQRKVRALIVADLDLAGPPGSKNQPAIIRPVTPPPRRTRRRDMSPEGQWRTWLDKVRRAERGQGII